MKWVEKEIALGAPLARFQYDASDKNDNGKKCDQLHSDGDYNIDDSKTPRFWTTLFISEYNSN